jgi:hypothetical protein
METNKKEIWLKLQEDVFEYGLMAEFAEFYLENPDLSILEIDRQFRNEWDLYTEKYTEYTMIVVN